MQVQAVAGVARQAVWAGKGAVLLENRSLTQPVFIGTDEGFSPDDQNTSIIDPLGSKGFDGTMDVWCRLGDGVAGFALIVANPGGMSSQVSPILIAEQLAESGLATAANQVTQNTAIPAGIAATGVPSTLVAAVSSSGPFAAAGGTWGPVNITFTTGGGYEIVLTPTTAGKGFLTDLFVQHLDGSGAVVWQEQFTVGNHNWGGVAGTIGGVVIRGNLHGPTLSISGNAATQAVMNAMLAYPAGNNPIGSFGMKVYSLPFFAESEPRVMPLAQISGFLGRDTSGAFSGVAGQILNLGPLMSYTGPAIFNVAAGPNQGGGFEFFGEINGRNVANGGLIIETLYSACVTGVNVGTFQEVFLDGNLHTLGAVNLSTVALAPFITMNSKANI